MFNELYFELKEIIKQRDFSFLVFIISLFLLPLSINFSTFTLILALGLKVIQVIFTSKKLFASKVLKNSSLLGMVFFVFIILNSLFQADFSRTAELFNKQYSHFALLFLIPILLRDKKENKLLLYSFLCGTLITITIGFIVSILDGISFNRNIFLTYFDIHHTYLAIFLLFTFNHIIVKTIQFNKELTNLNKMIIVFILFCVIAVMYVIKSKASMIIIVVLLAFYILSRFNRKKLPLYLGFLIAGMVLIYTFNNKIEISYENALDFRLQIWEQSVKVFKENPVLGDSELPEKDLLNYQHYLSGKYFFLDSDLNSHNQYLSILMRFGLVGSIILLLSALYAITLLINCDEIHIKNEFIGVSLIILFVFYIENILDRHHGIVFFAVFFNYYLVALENEKN